MEVIVRQFLPEAGPLEIHPLGEGLIHQTYKVSGELLPEKYILQAFSDHVFQEPQIVFQNYQLAARHLSQQDYPFIIPDWVKTLDNQPYYRAPEGKLWRMLTFVPKSTAFEYPPEPQFLSLAVQAYGIYARCLKNLPVNELQESIPDFHNLSGRYERFQEVIKQQPSRLSSAQSQTSQILKYYDQLDLDFSDLPIRATHNDCKLSNVLFHQSNKQCLAIIDWDTLMPGYLVTDFGDMVRSMCASAAESERDLSKVYFLPKAYEQIRNAFLNETEAWMLPIEKENLFEGALYIVLEQAMRFLTDYLQGDIYYGEKYPDQNLHRTNNQLQLLQSMLNSSPH